MKAYILGLGIAVALGMTSCLDAHVTDEEFPNSTAQNEQLEQALAGSFTTDNGANHSNKIRVFNNSGYDAQLDYIVGKTILGCGKDNFIDVIVPFAGTLTFNATVIADGTIVEIPFDVVVEDLDSEIDPLFKALTNGSAEGKTWEWWANQNEDGSWAYIDGSWGCVGGGGYGWSATGPNWLCYGIGDTDEWTGQLVSMDEWVKFDVNGGPNVTVHYSDGSEATGTFSLTSGTTDAKAALGWVGTMKLTVALPHQITGDQASWYLDIPVDEFDVAMLDDEHLILIAPGGGGEHNLCDDSWAISSTHWTFQVKK